MMWEEGEGDLQGSLPALAGRTNGEERQREGRGSGGVFNEGDP